MEITFTTKIDLDKTFFTRFRGKIIEANCYSILRHECVNSGQSETFYFVDSIAIPEEHVFKTKLECKEALKTKKFNYGTTGSN